LQNSAVFLQFVWNIFKRIVLDEYYLFSSGEYALAVGWSLLWQQST